MSFKKMFHPILRNVASSPAYLVSTATRSLFESFLMYAWNLLKCSLLTSMSGYLSSGCLYINRVALDMEKPCPFHPSTRTC
jgi:hypothetical protein